MVCLIKRIWETQKKKFDIVIHLAAYTKVAESVRDPKKYYENNFTKGKIFFETVYNSQKKRIFNALKSSSSDSVIKFKNVLKKIIDGK